MKQNIDKVLETLVGSRERLNKVYGEFLSSCKDQYLKCKFFSKWDSLVVNSLVDDLDEMMVELLCLLLTPESVLFVSGSPEETEFNITNGRKIILLKRSAEINNSSVEEVL